MKKIIITILVISVVLASCGSESGKRIAQNTTSTAPASRNIAFRAHHTWISTVTYDRLVDYKVEIVYADSAFRVGDTIAIDDKNYILEEKVN